MIGNPRGQSPAEIYEYGQFTFEHAGFDKVFPGPHGGVLLKTNWFSYLDSFHNDNNTMEGVERYSMAIQCSSVLISAFSALLFHIGFWHPYNLTRKSKLTQCRTKKLEDSLKILEFCKHCHPSFHFSFISGRQFTVSSVKVAGQSQVAKGSYFVGLVRSRAKIHYFF